MAAYAALVSLAQTTALTGNHDKYLFSTEEERIRSINEYVIFMLSFLEDFPEKANRWEGRIRDVAHEIEDIVEQFMWQSRYIRMKPPSVNLEDQLEDLTEEIGQIAGQMMEERPAYLPAAVSSPSTPASNDAVVGLAEDLMAIKERLCGNSSKLQVIPIVGMAGIGKTTLATTVYEDPLILEYFDIRAWVVVSQDYTPRKILLILLNSMKLLEESEEEECGNLQKHVIGEKIEGPADMAKKIYQNLKGRRYLVVMDDVWSIEVLDDVRNIFPDDNNGSRIMFTTRLVDVAAYPDPYSHLHEMQFMDDEQSWTLLKHKVFENGDCPPELEGIGKEIARRCAGLPLAVVLVAGVLLSAVNTNRASWEEIARNVNPVIKRELEGILSLSYSHLPHHLRPCFLYMGGFPEDESILASTLIKLWVAEGFVNGCSKSSEEKAGEYLEGLVKRNLVIVTSRKSDGKIKSCSLHDTVRLLCIRKAHHENFLHVVDDRDLLRHLMFRG